VTAASRADRALIAALRAELGAHADAKKAPQIQSYLKSEMPCHGVSIPRQREIVASVSERHPLTSFKAWEDTVLELWQGAVYREERSCAIHLTGQRRYRQFQTLDALPLYEELIVTGAWWDLVDDVATHRLGPLLVRYRQPMREEMLAWSRSDSLWKRRSSIICQLSLKDDTDLELLYACIGLNLAGTDIFIRKAIGWALRTVARSNPSEVVRYVRAHEGELSELSRHEALRNTPGS